MQKPGQFSMQINTVGKYALEGPLGVVGGKLVMPGVSEVESMLDSVSGTSLGVSGYIFTQETRVLFGLGPPVAFTGLYVKIITAAGITRRR